MRRNTDNPTGTTFVAATDPVTVTLSLSNFQHSVPTSDFSTGRAMNFGSLGANTGTAIYATLNGIGSPADSEFSSLPSTVGQGVSVTKNGAVQLYLSTEPLNGVVATNTRNYYGDLTVSFSRPLTNPTLHISGLGGSITNGSTLGITTELDLDTKANPAVTLSKISGTSNFTVNATQILNTATHPNSSCANATGACGSVLATGNAISSLKFKVYLRGDGGLSAWGTGGDAFYFAGVSVLDEYDYGDAPATYGTPSHTIVAGLQLGATAPDGEVAAQPSATATLDDTTGTDDEDAIASFPTLTAGATTYSLSNIPVTNTTGSPATLYGWIDVNRNGRFDGNEVATATVANGAASANLNWSGLTGVTAGSSYVRLRLTTQALTNTNSGTLTNLDTRSDGAASDGEVEDYALTIAAAPVIINCPTSAAGSGSGYASSGTGLYKNDIFWLDWSCGATTQFNPGDVVNKSWTLANGLQITAQITNITAAIAPYNTGTWGGDTLDNLYTGVNPIGLTNLIDSQDPTYSVAFTAKLNGTTIPADIVMAEAEDTGSSNESATWTTDGSAWQPIEAFGSLSAQFTNSGKTVFMNNDPDTGGGTLLAFSRDVSSIGVDMKAGGKEALGFGVFASFDYGDIKAGYPASQGHYMRKLASGGSTPATLTAVSSLTMATLSNSTALYLGAIQPDAETADQNSVNADADGSEEDGIALPTLIQGQPATITATVAGAGGYLQGWIDWNGDGDFADSGEQVATNIQDNGTGDTNATAGTIAFAVNVPAGATANKTYARFRWSTTMGLNATTAASDGEVEDYWISIGDGGYKVSGRVFNDVNVNAVDDSEKGIKAVTVVLQDVAAGTCRSTKTGADGSYAFTGVQPAAANNYVLYEAASEKTAQPDACPPAANDPNGYLSTTPNSLTVTVSNADVTGQDFGDVKQPTLTLDNEKVILPDTSVLYPHVFRNSAAGSVAFNLVNESVKPAGSTWGSALYFDANCNAKLDTGDTPLNAPMMLVGAGKVCMLVKVIAPANVSAGASHSIQVQSTFTFGGGNIVTAADVQTRTDLTSVSSGTSAAPVGGEGKLSLEKSVWNTTRNIDGSVALPGETLRYTINYENIGNGALDELAVHDSVPAFTVLVGGSLQCLTTPAELTDCSPSSTATSLDWAFTGKLQPGSRGAVAYDVTVQ
jgi:uncharacterized repeat protein (TIGR01451 family)